MTTIPTPSTISAAQICTTSSSKLLTMTPHLDIIAQLLTKISIFVLLFATLVGHAGKSIPRDQLGQRPYGSYLGSRLYRHFRFNRGCKGYDTSLGAYSPSVNVLFHLGCGVVLWTIILKLRDIFRRIFETDGEEFCVDRLEQRRRISAEIQDAAIYAGIIYCIAYYINVMIWNKRGVSYPGGPRPHKIQRKPKWKSGVRELPKTKEVTWRCAVAEESHKATHAAFGMEHGKVTMAQKSYGGVSHPDGIIRRENIRKGLTGEPFGRQIWVAGKTSSRASATTFDADVLDRYAGGGREYTGFDPSINPNTCDSIFRRQRIQTYLSLGKSPPDCDQKPKTAKEASKKAAHFYSMLQTEDGHWAGDYGGPHFLMPGLIITWYVMDKPTSMINSHERTMMQHYLLSHQQADGGWGTHIESPSTMFGTVLCYVALRLLGADRDSEECKNAIAFIQKEGGAVMASSWAKFWLCILGCMEWEGHNSVPPEMWLLPDWFPFHPSRLWCHCRMVYLPMGYLYGSRFIYSKAETDPLIQSLRSELYTQLYTVIPWDKTRHCVAPMDNYSPIPWIMRFLQNALAVYESFILFRPFKNIVRSYGLQFCVEYMAAEDLQTNFIDIGPVNKAMNLLSAYHVANGNINHATVQNHLMRVPDYLWLAEDGMKMQGYNGSQCWDTSFAIQAIAESQLLDDFPSVSTKVWSYLERTQILSTDVSRSSPANVFESSINRDRFYRHVSKGGWPFSTSAHGWPISDCTGEGLKAVLALTRSSAVTDGIAKGALRPIDGKRLFDAVNVILTLQNLDGGWATYENNRGFGWYEYLNPSEVFGDIMIDYSYVECTMASLTALAEFHERYPSHRTHELLHAIQRGREFIKSIQRPDGSWYGSWACCFCYACWFGIEGLIKAGEPRTSPAITECCQFLLSHQRPNGGWGEDFTSCYDKDYAADGMLDYGDEGSGIVNTAWALLALSAAKCDNVDAIKKGCLYLMKRQLPTGDFPQEGISGVFNRACGITYTSYRNIFPMWALGRCAVIYGDAIDADD